MTIIGSNPVNFIDSHSVVKALSIVRLVGKSPVTHPVKPVSNRVIRVNEIKRNASQESQ